MRNQPNLFISTFIFCSYHLLLRHIYSPRIRGSNDVGFETFPPLINEDGSGLLIDILNILSADNNLHFNFHIMTHARAKQDLKSKRLKLIGLTPDQLEMQHSINTGANSIGILIPMLIVSL